MSERRKVTHASRTSDEHSQPVGETAPTKLTGLRLVPENSKARLPKVSPDVKAMFEEMKRRQDIRGHIDEDNESPDAA